MGLRWPSDPDPSRSGGGKRLRCRRRGEESIPVARFGSTAESAEPLIPFLRDHEAVNCRGLSTWPLKANDRKHPGFLLVLLALLGIYSIPTSLQDFVLMLCAYKLPETLASEARNSQCWWLTGKTTYRKKARSAQKLTISGHYNPS